MNDESVDRMAKEFQETGRCRAFGETVLDVVRALSAIGVDFDKVVLDNDDDVSIVGLGDDLEEVRLRGAN
jgi:hypothetical protein